MVLRAAPISAAISSVTGATPAMPALVYLHGGGFVVGGIDTCEAMCSQVAHQSGAAVVAIDYRLAPEHKYPAGLEDCMAALRWLVEHGHTQHLDASRMAVGGDSAGGTLAAILAVVARDAEIPLGRIIIVHHDIGLTQGRLRD